MFFVSAWRSGGYSNVTGRGYGFRFSNRMHLLLPSGSLQLWLPALGRWESIKVAVSRCPEIRSKFIGQQIIADGKVPWTKKQPPFYVMVRRDYAKFELLPRTDPVYGSMARFAAPKNAPRWL